MLSIVPVGKVAGLLNLAPKPAELDQGYAEIKGVVV